MAATTINRVQQANSTNLLSLASLADNTLSAAGSAINNAFGQPNLGGYPLCKLCLSLGAYTGTPSAGAAIYVWFLASIDGGTTYEDSSSARPPDVIIPIGLVASGPQKITLKDVELPVGNFKTIVKTSGIGLTLGTISLDALPNSFQGQ